MEKISDYLKVRDKIPTGYNQNEQIQTNKKKILRLLNGSEDDWNCWKWQLKNAIRNVETLSKIIQLSDVEKENINKTATQYRWSISPYYASLMNPEDSDCPVRMQAVPSIREYLTKEESKASL